MTIDRMGPVDPIKNLNKTDPLKKTADAVRPDSIEVSSEAKAQAEVFAAREAVRSAPEIREDRVAEMRLKLQNPNYFDQTVLDGTAENIMRSFGL
jgi:negative regulator of flagellin synthesis FlgM